MRANRNASLLRWLLVEADALGCNVARSEFPVLLRPIAERRRVTSVEFRPLLVDAMLTTHPQGFRILFNSNGANASELQGRYENESRERLMPPRLRFSLAHELAHTLFYDLSNETPQVTKEFRSGGKRSALENLERSCNKLAAQLLLPTPMLKTTFRSMRAITPESLLEFARRAGVSVEVLLRRLDETSSIFVDRYFRGCIALAKQVGDEVTVAAIAKPQHLNIARDLLLMRPGERWQLAACNGTQIHPANLPPISLATLAVETHRATAEQPYQIAVVKAGRFDSTVSFLLTFEEAESH